MFEPNTLGKKAGYLIAVSRLKVIYEIGKIIARKNLLLISFIPIPNIH